MSDRHRRQLIRVPATIPFGEVRWYAWREVRPALAHARTGGIALHRFRYDLRRFGLGRNDPACHVLSADRPGLVAFVGAFGLRERWIQPPRPHRPEVWHFDAFGIVLEWLEEAYPPPAGIDERSPEHQGHGDRD